VSNRTRYIRDNEDRLDTDDALHSEIIGGRLPASVSTSASGDIRAHWPTRRLDASVETTPPYVAAARSPLLLVGGKA
jgi:hypothetical protein